MRLATMFAALTLTTATLVTAGSATAAPAPAEKPVITSPADAEWYAEPGLASQRIRAKIVFNKNPTNQFQSRLVWKVERRNDAGKWRVIERKVWRAGSGLPDQWGKDECVRNHGWAPNGTYAPIQYDQYDGSVINGRVFFLGAKRCTDGTMRSQLFIHSEANPDNTQCADAAGDQSCRWEHPAINEYKSNGCIKMAPGDMKALTKAYHRYFKAGLRYPTRQFKVDVIA
ncbi:hypothetical protein [Nocardioides speluncae]|uniref:hypothetical protein n=1 Tax=Nocardioides speluncae TaxID=2670337 RepID=UPI000D6A023D|nr:hypothetical protein [Nocardioides speluncae]